LRHSRGRSTRWSCWNGSRWRNSRCSPGNERGVCASCSGDRHGERQHFPDTTRAHHYRQGGWARASAGLVAAPDRRGHRHHTGGRSDGNNSICETIEIERVLTTALRSAG
jgi:hypothetical protein